MSMIEVPESTGILQHMQKYTEMMLLSLLLNVRKVMFIVSKDWTIHNVFTSHQNKVMAEFENMKEISCFWLQHYFTVISNERQRKGNSPKQ